MYAEYGHATIYTRVCTYVLNSNSLYTKYLADDMTKTRETFDLSVYD